jgi:hypothetical protein
MRISNEQARNHTGVDSVSNKDTSFVTIGYKMSTETNASGGKITLLLLNYLYFNNSNLPQHFLVLAQESVAAMHPIFATLSRETENPFSLSKLIETA